MMQENSIDIMIDLETLGTRPGSVITQIGAVNMSLERIKRGAPLETFEMQMDVHEQVAAGYHVDGDTLKWWADTNLEQLLMMMCSDSYPTLRDMLVKFTDWVQDFQAEEVRVWGNGSDFDNALLAEAYRRNDIAAPWKFYHNRCYRTLKSLHPHVKLERQGEHHHALADALSQTDHWNRIITSWVKPEPE